MLLARVCIPQQSSAAQTLVLSTLLQRGFCSFAVAPGSLLHIVTTNPATSVRTSNQPGLEDAVQLDLPPGRCLAQQLPGGRIIDVVEHTADGNQEQQQQAGVTLAGTIPSRFCGLSVTTAGGSVTVGQLQEADMQLSTSGGSVDVARCRAHNASINTAVQPGLDQQQQEGSAVCSSPTGGSIQVGELSASRVSVYSGGAPVAIKRLFGLTVDVLSAGGGVDVGSVYADRAAVSTAAGPASVLRTGAAGAAGTRSTAAAGAGGGVSSSGRLRVGHIACLKGEARLESGGGPLEVDGLEGNAALLSSGGDVKVHLHEHAGLVYVDSDGGSVTAWLSPSGTPLGLQVKAAGGVSLDPALKVTGEVGPTMLFGVTSGDGTISSMSSTTSAMVQRAVEAAHSSAQLDGSSSAQSSPSMAFSASSGGCSAPAAARWKQNEQQVAAWSQATQEQQQQQAQVAGAAAGEGCGGSTSTASSPAATRQLVINAGWGCVELKAMGWMDGLKARMAQQAKEQQQAAA